jgi:hypothetical protein
MANKFSYDNSSLRFYRMSIFGKAILMFYNALCYSTSLVVKRHLLTLAVAMLK